MSPRARNAGNRDLPPHVEVDTKNGVKYYRYVMPDGKRHSLGKDKQTAVDAAMTLNVELARNPDILARIMSKKLAAEVKANPVPPLEYAIEQFKLRLQQKTYADSTRENHRYLLAEYVNRWGSRRVNDITVLDVAGLLNEKPAHSYIKHRIMLIDLWSFMSHQGWVKENIANLTMEAIVPKKQRQRHTLEALMQIRAISPNYLQRAIDLALHSVQRRGDLVKLKRTAINIPANTMTVLQEKSRNYATPVYIEVDMHPELQQAIMSCISNPLAFKCPYLLNYRPGRMTKQCREQKLHHLAMTENFVTKEFARCRDESGVYSHLEPGQRPSFHDIRALGIKLITEKYGQAYAMALAGHADERMWKHYLEGHEEVKPVRVSYR
jgi:integrase